MYKLHKPWMLICFTKLLFVWINQVLIIVFSHNTKLSNFKSYNLFELTLKAFVIRIKFSKNIYSMTNSYFLIPIHFDTLLLNLFEFVWISILFIFLKLFVAWINCYFLLVPFASGAAPTLIPYIYDPVIKHWLRPDHLEMVRNNIISEIFERKQIIFCL